MHLVWLQLATYPGMIHPPTGPMPTPLSPGGVTPATCHLSSMHSQRLLDTTALCLLMPRP